MPIKIQMSPSPDAGALSAIHRACFEPGWDEEAIKGLVAPESTLALLAGGPPAQGFLLLRNLGSEAEILTFAVSPTHRRHGLGRALMMETVDHARRQGMKAIFLEVKEGNAAALKLYANFGFRKISVRKDYYRVGKAYENALVLRLDLTSR